MEVASDNIEKLIDANSYSHHLYTFCGEDNGAFIQTVSLEFKR